jgi:hypothetical protein
MRRRGGEDATLTIPGIASPTPHPPTTLPPHTLSPPHHLTPTFKTTGYAGNMPLYALGVNKRGFAVAGGGGGVSYLFLSTL